MYRSNYENTVDVLSELAADLECELPGSLPLVRDLYRQMAGHGRLGRREVTIPKRKWTALPGAETKQPGGRPRYLAVRRWLTARRHNDAPVLVEVGGGGAKTFRLNLPWCDREPFGEVEETLEPPQRPDLRTVVRMLRPPLRAAHRRIAQAGDVGEWEEEHREQFGRSAVGAVCHGLLAARGRKPDLVCDWPCPGVGAHVAAWWGRARLGRRPARRGWRSAVLGDRSPAPYLLVNVGWGRGGKDPELHCLKEVGWQEGLRGAQCQYLCLGRPAPDFLERASEWGIDVVALPSVALAGDEDP